MAYMKCPVCGSSFHLKPTDAEAWRRTHQGSDPVSGVCFPCWGGLGPGQQVTVRWLSYETRANSNAVSVGDVGRVVEILRSTPDGMDDEYRVQQADEPPKWTAILKRKELQRVMGGPPLARR